MLHVKLLDENVPLPKRQTRGSGGYDIYTPVAHIIPSGTRVNIPVAQVFGIPEGYVGFLKSRSSMARVGIDVVGGVIDSDYTGEVSVLLQNTTSCDHHLKEHQRIAQLVILPVFTGDVQRVFDLRETRRGAGGFGSTGR